MSDSRVEIKVKQFLCPGIFRGGILTSYRRGPHKGGKKVAELDLGMGLAPTNCTIMQQHEGSLNRVCDSI